MINVSDDGGWDRLEAKDALHIYLDGAYGEYVDPIGRISSMICKHCADTLILAHPFLKTAIENSYLA